MHDEATSQHLRNAHELFLLVPLKRGFVEQSERLTSYPTRLRALLALLFGPTRSAVERTAMPTSNTIERLQNLYGFHYGVSEQLQDSRLILGATFDSSWEIYFHNLVDQAGPFLDAIFCHCQGFEGRACADGYEAFAGFVREHQVQSGIFYSAVPDLTVDDLRALRKVARAEPVPEPLPSVADDVAAAKTAWEARMRASQGADEFARSRAEGLSRFVASLWEMRRLFPPSERVGTRTARDIFDAAARQMVESYLTDSDALRLLPEGAEAWLAGLRAPRTSVPVARAPITLRSAQLHNIQGNILEPFARVRHGAVVMVELPVEARARAAFLAALSARVTTMDRASEPVRVNVALTLAGLARIGLDDDVIALFPKEFREGMEQRAGLLGDVGHPNHPEHWQPLEINWPAPERADEAAADTFTLARVDVVLNVQADRPASGNDHTWTRAHPLHDDVCALLAELGVRAVDASSARVLRVEPLRRTTRDAFDLPGLPKHESQPRARARWEGRSELPAQQHYDPEVALGEILLGYPDKRDQVAASTRDPEWARLFQDGTFVVMRKLQQDFDGLEKMLSESAARPDHPASEEARAKVHALVLGRDPSGPTLATSSGEADRFNDFHYRGPRGAGCPLYAHVRRTNPRLSDTPRIVRRSFSYGSEYVAGEPADRGHFFVAYNASIAQQFEVIQRWINGGNSTGLLSTKPDLLASTLAPAPHAEYPAPTSVCPRGVLSLPGRPLVTLAWGAYLFVPSRAALALLSEVEHGRRDTSARARRAAEQRGDRRIRELDAIASPAHARLSWQQLLEEATHAGHAADVWRAIRASGGSKETPYGLLVGDVATARRVLADDGRAFSVREYWQRLRGTIGEHYLALDRTSGAQTGARGTLEDELYEQRLRQVDYQALAALPNRVLRESVDAKTAYRTAFLCASARLATTAPVLDLRDLAKLVVCDLAERWVGIPSAFLPTDERPDGLTDDERRRLMESYIFVSRACFYPYPEAWLVQAATSAGRALQAAYAQDDLLLRPFAQRLAGEGYDPRAIRSAMMGALTGFVAPAVSLIAGVLAAWLEDGTLARLGPRIRDASDEVTCALLLGPLLETMRAAPVPPLLYRRALAGNGLTAPGNVVVVSLQSICMDVAERSADVREGAPGPVPWAWLFGGERAERDPVAGTVHGCPMRDPALQAILGTLAAVARFVPYERESPTRFRRG